MKKIKFNIYLLLIVGLAACNSTTSDKTNDIYKASYGNGTNTINVATGSPGELGLLKELAENYPAINEVKINWRKAGSGKSLQLLHEKEVDIVMVH
ncbi:MAG: ABC transporter substrate-binding protein, partial [Bacteroidota bacterium]|nr:ABC transporter substrate-binding protein [Bacteroidota bacterium]